MSQWQKLLAAEKNKAYFQTLQQFISQQRQQARIFPQSDQQFRAFELTPYEEVKVVILGQDPYHGEGQAHGLSFSVPQNITIPPSLRNIFKELADDIGCQMPSKGDLTSWAQQGVLLLNSVLTVEEGKANSHKNKGWETFTDHVISVLNDRQQPIIFVLWGKPAQAKMKLITATHHIILTAPHPSPLSAYRGFFGSRPFSQINQQLIALKQQPIDWQLS